MLVQQPLALSRPAGCFAAACMQAHLDGNKLIALLLKTLQDVHDLSSHPGDECLNNLENRLQAMGMDLKKEVVCPYQSPVDTIWLDLHHAPDTGVGL